MRDKVAGSLRRSVTAERGRDLTGDPGMEPHGAAEPKLRAHNPARFRADGSVQVYVRVSNAADDDALRALRAAGLQVETVSNALGIVQGWTQADNLDYLAALDLVDAVDLPRYASQRAGSRLTEGDAILRSNLLRALNVSGAGVRIGIISDGANDWMDARDSGDLPAGGISLFGDCEKRAENNSECDPGADCNEGTAMAEIIHDIAPGAEIAVGAASTSAEFIERINDLVNVFGADIIVDDLGFRNEPFLEDGPVAQAVQAATVNVLFVSAVGNSADRAHESNFIDEDPSPSAAFHDFGVAAGQGSDWAFPVYAERHGLGVAFLQWSDPFGASSNDYDLHVDIYNANTGQYIDTLSSIDEQSGTQDPVEWTGFCNPYRYPLIGFFYIERYAGSNRFLEVQAATNANSAVLDYAIAEGSVYGHPAVPGALAVGAVRANDPGHDTIEYFSSQGPARIFQPSVEIRDKPDLVAIDGVSVTGTGGFVETFYGTSAAAPHVAAIAALLREAMPHATPAALRSALLDGAVDLGATGRDLVFGEGRVDAMTAEALLDTDDDGQLNGVDEDDDADTLSDMDELSLGTFRLDTDSDDDDVQDNLDAAPLDMFACMDSDADQCDDCASGVFDPAQDGRDTNQDGICDVGDTDDDGDTIEDLLDNCPRDANFDQEDFDDNGIGDACQHCAWIRQTGSRYLHLCL